MRDGFQEVESGRMKINLKWVDESLNLIHQG